MNRSGRTYGFTLMELVVVILIICTMLVVAMPVFKGTAIFPGPAAQAVQMVNLINRLKKQAVEQQTDLYLHIDPASCRLWITGRSKNTAPGHGVPPKNVLRFSSIAFSGVEFYGSCVPCTGEYEILFSMQGYSDYALIHMTETGKPLTLRIEPFIDAALIQDRHVSFRDCL